MDEVYKGSLLAIASGLLIGANVVFGAVLAKQLNVFYLSAFSVLASVPFLFFISFFSGERISLRELFSAKKSFIETLALRLIVGDLLLMIGLSLTSGAKASALLRIEPVFVLFFGILLFKEKLAAKKMLLFFLALVGALLVSTSGILEFSSANLGDALIVIAIFLYSYTYFTAQHVMQKTSGLNIAFWLNLFGGLALLAIALALFPLDLGGYAPNAGLFLLFVLSFYVFGFWLYNLSLKKIPAWLVSILLSFEVLSALLLSVFWLQEQITVLQGVGTAVLIISSALIVKE